MNSDLYTLSTSDLRWYISFCARPVYHESVCDDDSPEDFLTCVNSSKLIGARFKSNISEGVGARKKRATESYFGGSDCAYVTASTDKVSQETCVVEIQRAYKTLYVINQRTKMLPTSRWKAVSFKEACNIGTKEMKP